MKKSTKICKGCQYEFTLSTANNEQDYCSQLCEGGKYPLKRRKYE